MMPRCRALSFPIRDEPRPVSAEPSRDVAVGRRVSLRVARTHSSLGASSALDVAAGYRNHASVIALAISTNKEA